MEGRWGHRIAASIGTVSRGGPMLPEAKPSLSDG